MVALSLCLHSLHDCIIYDGGHDIYSADRLPGIGKVPTETEMKIVDPLGRDNLILKYHLMEVQTVSSDDVQQYVENPKATSLNIPQVMFMFYNHPF